MAPPVHSITLDRSTLDSRAWTVVWHGCQYSGDFISQHRDMVLNHVPDDVVINAEVAMDNEIAKTDDLSSLDFDMLCSCFCRNLGSRFTDDDEPAD